MSKFNHVVTNFNTGEISDRALGRIDFKEYSNSCKQYENFIPLQNGGATKRPGTQFFKELELKGGDASIYPFYSSRGIRYIILFEASSAIPLSTGNIRIFNASTGNVVHDIVWPMLDVRSGKFTFTNIGDALFFAHSDGDQFPFSIYLADHAAETFTVQNIFLPFPSVQIPQVESFMRVPYLDRNISALTLSFSGTTGVQTVTSSADLFHVDMELTTFFRVVHGTTEGVFVITQVNSPTSAEINIVQNLGGTAASTNWAESAWSGYRGWPTTITFFEQRIYYANTLTEPDKFWGSKAGNGVQFMEEKLLQDQDSATDVSGNFYFGAYAESDPFQKAIGSSKTQNIKWINSGQVLSIGTNAGEYVATGHDKALNTVTASIVKQTSYGGKKFRTESIGDEIVYFSQDGRRVRSFGFSAKNGSNISLDLTILADHMYRGNEDSVFDEFRDAMYSASRDCLWILTERGSLIALSYSKELSLLAWHRHKISGYAGSPNILSSMVLENDELDSLFLLTDRGEKRVLEFIGDDFLYTSLFEDFSATQLKPVVFLDGAWVTSFTGSAFTLTPEYFKNTTVSVTKNGLLLGDFAVNAAGEVDISPHSGTIFEDIFTFGYKYTSTLETSDIEAGGDFGFADGATQRIDRVTAKLFKTFDLKVGVSDGQMDPVSMGNDVYTGDKRINLAQSPGTVVRVKMQSEQPYPCTILSLALRGVSYD